MNKEDKELLLKDLCYRLPYGVIVEIEDEPQTPVQFEWQHLNFIINWEWTIKPYLRPMSSMTEEERNEVNNLIKCNRPTPYGKINNKGIDNLFSSVSVTSGVLIDWLNAHHFDYRGLIEAGLALEAPEGMYNLNKE